MGSKNARRWRLAARLGRFDDILEATKEAARTGKSPLRVDVKGGDGLVLLEYEETMELDGLHRELEAARLAALDAFDDIRTSDPASYTAAMWALSKMAAIHEKLGNVHLSVARMERELFGDPE